MANWSKRPLCVIVQLGWLVLLAAAPARADDPPAASRGAGGGATPVPPSEKLEAVVVTAQRRAERLQDVPIAVTAITARQLQERRIDNVADLNSLAPGLQVSKTPANNTISQIAIRGITEINPAIYWDSAVGLYLDGVYIGKAQGSIFDIVDLQRIEVLRGPQGTLYGRNTVAGAINLVTARPSGEFGVNETLEVGNYDAVTEKVSADLPKFAGTSIALGARWDMRDGWVTTTPGSSADQLANRKNLAYRLGADFDLLPGLEAAYRYDHSHTDQNPAYSQLYRADQMTWTQLSLLTATPGFANLPSYASHGRQTVASIDAPVFEKVKIDGHSLTLSWNVTDGDVLKSISAYRHMEWDDSLDLDGSPLPVAFTQRFTHYHSVSQELQWVGHGGPWNYVGGLYYFGDDGRTNNPQQFFNKQILFDSQYGTKTSAGAAYGQLDYRPLDALTLSAGLRYTLEKKSLDRVFGCNYSNPVLASKNNGTNCQAAPGQYDYLMPAGTHGDKSFRATTPAFAADYKLLDNLNLYFRFAEGFKSGGFNGEFSDPSETRQANIDETRTPFRPERQKTFELGAKGAAWNGRAQLAAALFLNKDKDLQESIFLASGAAASRIRNAGRATVKGVELESSLSPWSGQTLQLNYAYLDARFDQFIDDTGADVHDNRAFVHAPRNAANLVSETRLLRFGTTSLTLLLDYAYTAGFYTYPYQLTGPGQAGYNSNEQVAGDTRVKGYGLLNGRLSLAHIPLGESAYGEVALWGRNLSDEKIPANFIDFGPIFGSLTDAYFIEPRTYGVAGLVRW